MDFEILFPEIKFISEIDLAEKCRIVWDETIQKAKLTDSEVKSFPFAAHELNHCPVSLVNHTRYVTQTAYKLATDFNVWYKGSSMLNINILIAASILHDVGKLVEYIKTGGAYVQSELGKIVRHPTLGAIFAYEAGLPMEVIHMIQRHSFEGDKLYLSDECLILRQADSLHFQYCAKHYSLTK